MPLQSKERMLKVEIPEQQLTQVLELVSPGLAKYQWIQTQIQSCDPTVSDEFQRRFGGFYRVRRNKAWRSIFYSLLKKARDEGCTFQNVIEDLALETGRVEASFSSKLFATVYPNSPVIDSIVLDNLALRLPSAKESNRIQKICELYSHLNQAYTEYLGTPSGQRLVRAFEERYPGSGIEHVKMVDFVLWQSRPSKLKKGMYEDSPA